MSCCTQVDKCTGKNSPRVMACFSRQEQRPALRDALGPFPDEVIMTAIDRVLYYSGATKIYHLLDLANMIKEKIPSVPPLPIEKQSNTSIASATSNMGLSQRVSLTSLGKYFTAKSQASVKQSNTNCASQKSSSFKSVHCNKIPTSQRLRTPRVDFANPVCDNRQMAGGPTISDRMKHSLSTCSSAFERLKTKLVGSDLGNKQQQLWTRMVPTSKGCQVYEVYSNSDKSKATNGKQPVILFLIMPNGSIMPFETVTSFLNHKQNFGKSS